MITGDGAYIKQLNRSLILKEINEKGQISRAALSKIIGLNKATVSSQIAQLLEEDLIYETAVEHSGVGRKPIMLSINEKAGYVLGIDLDKGSIQYRITDLAGSVIRQDTNPLDTMDYEQVLERLSKMINQLSEEFQDAAYGLIRATIGIHGTVTNEQDVHFVPKFNWRELPFQKDLQVKTAIPVTLENNANLSAYAEKVYVHHDSEYLLSVIFSSGIGTGIILNGELERGFDGYAGELGHMIIYPDGKPCTCGNSGCWELYASELSFLELLARSLNKPDLTLQEIHSLLQKNDPTVKQQLDHFIRNIAIGINNIINLYNPKTLVLNSDVLQHVPGSLDLLQDHLSSNISRCDEILLSTLGSHACVMGACAMNIRTFLKTTQLRLPVDSH